MAASPHKPHNLALARETLTNLDMIRQWTPDQRAQIVELAQTVLRTDRNARLNLDPARVCGPARILRVPRAVFQSGLPPQRRTAAPHAPYPFTPGDAA